jgi:hypothetical protein
MNFYARDVYPEQGLLDTSTSVIPDEFEQRLVETDEKAIEQSKKVTANATKKGTGLTLLTVFLVIFALGVLR